MNATTKKLNESDLLNLQFPVARLRQVRRGALTWENLRMGFPVTVEVRVWVPRSPEERATVSVEQIGCTHGGDYDRLESGDLAIARLDGIARGGESEMADLVEKLDSARIAGEITRDWMIELLEGD